MTEFHLSISDYLFNFNLQRVSQNFYPFSIQRKNCFISFIIFSFQFRLTEADLFVNYGS